MEKIHGLIQAHLENSEDKSVKKHSDIKQFLSSLKMYKPKTIKKMLDDYVIGQEEAKISLSVAIYNHYKKIINNMNNKDDFLEKSNILMIGPSASGKTLLAKTIAKILGVPFCICDATTYTEAGYVGESVENCISKLLQVADYDIEKTQVGIIFIDEVDKITKKLSGNGSTKDPTGEGVQQGLLKIIEGSVVNVPAKPGKMTPDAEFIKIDTKNILFIFGGAFVGLREEKERSLQGIGQVGFGKMPVEQEDTSKKTLTYDPEDLIKYGFIPEFIGRIPIIVTLDKLTEDQFSKILLEPKDSIINQYTKLLKLDNIDLKFDHNAVKEIARRAYEKDIGARGLRSIIEKVMKQYMYDLPSSNKKKLLITKKIIDEKMDPSPAPKA